MDAVADLQRADAALLVSCRNCFREGKISARLLRDRFGVSGRIREIEWHCVGCGGRNVRLAIGSASLAELPQRHYRGLL